MSKPREKISLNMVITELLARDSGAVMLLVAADIGDYLCHEFFCEGIPYEHYLLLRDEFETNSEFRKALRKSGLIEIGVRRYIRAALDNYDMFYHFLDGINNILADTELTCMIPIRERNLVRSLFRLWNEGELNERNWDARLCLLRRLV